jgi:BMFP domain-containing protein YqiC
MTDTTATPLESLFSRLRDALGELAPEPLFDRMKPVIEGFLTQFQLVPKREYEAHMATLERLEDTVADLEARIAELERND